MPTKLTYQEVKDFVKLKGYILITTKYVNTLQKLEIICPKHGIQFVSMKWLRRGTGCFKCGQEKKGETLRTPFHVVKNEIENAGYILLSTEYKSNDSLLVLKCPTHGEFSTTYYTIKSGHQCKDCGYEKAGLKNRTPFEEIKNIVSKT